jgi:hypothetical protein
MRRCGIFVFNLLLGAGMTTVLGMLFRRLPMSVNSFGTAFLQFGLAGLVVGATVGVGAVMGPRPPLGWARSILAQALVAATSAVGGLIGGLFPRAFQAAHEVAHQALEDRGIIVGSWVGALAGAALEIIHVYRMRRRGEDRST